MTAWPPTTKSKATPWTVYKELYRRSRTVCGTIQPALQILTIPSPLPARRKELREIVENTQSQIAALTTKCEALDKLAKEAESNLAAAKQDLERALPFEKEVKEKNLLIGKLRHEAVTLNDHLRKALRMLKRDNAEDKIDKQLVTNVFLQFVSIQRGDQKKYEVLKLIASVLDWNDGAFFLCFLGGILFP
jgi:predicted metal-dependent hydrolase